MNYGKLLENGKVRHQLTNQIPYLKFILNSSSPVFNYFQYFYSTNILNKSTEIMCDTEVISAIFDTEVNQAKIKEFYEKHQQDFFLFAKSHYKIDLNTASEIYQEAHYILYTNFIDGRVADLKCSLKTYLFSIGKNLIMNEFKRRGKFEEFQLINTTIVLTDIEQIEIENEQSRKLAIVRGAVNELKDPCKKILTLFYWGKKKLEEILNEMSNYNNLNTLKTKKTKCLGRLEKIVVEEFAKCSLVV